MTRVQWLLLLVLMVATSLASARAQGLDFPLASVTRGVQGYGLTAGPDGIERFTVDILGLHDGFGLGFPLVLVQTRGDIIERAGGVAAGMSGSPVYLPLEGRDALLGAIGYVFPDSLGGLALVTPIGAMREAASQQPNPTRPSAVAASKLLPVATPLVVSGLGARALALLQEGLGSDAGPLQLQSGGGRANIEAAPLQAGSAVAVAWLTGDIEIAAVGTVTEVLEKQVLAFGHRLLGVGAIDWPLLPAAVVAIIPNRSVPFKLANVGRVTIGHATQDRAAALVARLDGNAAMLEVELTLVTDNATTSFRWAVVQDPGLWPALVAAATLEGIERARARVGPGSASVDWVIHLAGSEPLRLSEQVVAAGEVNLAAARLVAAPLQLLARNPFQDPRIERIALRVHVDDSRRDNEVLKVIDDGAEAIAGELVRLFVSLQPWRRAGVVLPVDVRWPDDLHGRVELVVRGASTPREAGADHPPNPDDAPLTFDELVVFLRERPAGGELVIEARRPGERWQRLARVPVQGFAHGRAEWSLTVTEPFREGHPETP